MTGEHTKREALNRLQNSQVTNEARLGAIESTIGTVTGAEMVFLEDLPSGFTFTPGAGGANVCEVVIQAVNSIGLALERPVLMTVWLCDALDGLGLATATASGTVTAKAASGTVFGTLTAKKALVVQTKEDGTFTLEITDTAKSLFVVAAQSMEGGKPSVAIAALIANNYGA